MKSLTISVVLRAAQKSLLLPYLSPLLLLLSSLLLVLLLSLLGGRALPAGRVAAYSKIPIRPPTASPKNTGKTPALAKMFNLSLMHVFIYKY